MKKYYCTFGSSEYFPYQNGWVEVMANSYNEATRKFQARYPSPAGKKHVPRYALIYSKEEFKKTIMWKDGNLGARCHAAIE